MCCVPVRAPSHPSLSSSLSAPGLVSRPASAAIIAGVSVSTLNLACLHAPNTSLIASSHFPPTHTHVAFAIATATADIMKL